jgi:hypothetical protein
MTTQSIQSVNAFTPEEATKLPKWAQEKVKSLSRERDIAVRELNEYLDTQTPSPVMVEEHPCIGEARGPSYKTRYIQAKDVKFVWQGVELTVSLRERGPQPDTGIQLSWSDEKRGIAHVCMMPLSFNRVQLITKENMR